ncbi:srg family chemoreceptor domain-containing protein [Ditylenchus destructor]|uniref:Serpentine receptor class gamma n=1 Tax=Ditylenchus destructor TaxID=166010 RepID=A0AAD4MV00_9BILA|nr:srg family chemoreceptor domain-containing protein [Ditylenchus destructor]
MGLGTLLASSPLPPFIVGLVIGVPSVILYLIETIVLIKYWKLLNTSFFRLFLVRFVLNFLNYLGTYISSRAGLVGLFYDFFHSMPSLFLAFWFTFYYYAFHAENLTTMFILINRLTSILLPLKHIQFTQPSFVSAVSAITFCVMCGVLNIATLIVYSMNINGKFIPTVNAQTDESQHRIESKLTVYALITFFGQLFVVLYMILINFCCIFGDGWGIHVLRLVQSTGVGRYFSTIVVLSWLLFWASNKIISGDKGASP